VVVDLSSPNLAKEMHVGHLRSTVIGDCIARVLEFEGHTVHRENHVGDWGTQFGMLIAYLQWVLPTWGSHQSGTKEDVDTGVGVIRQSNLGDKARITDRDQLRISDLESFYIQAKARFDADEDFREQSRQAVVALQRGDPEVHAIWQLYRAESLRHCEEIYKRLGVKDLIDRGESSYTKLMSEVIRRLEARMKDRDDGLVRISEGALCVFMDGFKTRQDEPLPLIVRKSDGGFNYATSDLAAILDRLEHQHAGRVIYVVGQAQKQHFEMVFAAARQLGWVPPGVRLEHLGFGNVLAATGRPFKTREGGTVKLKDLLDEAVARARQVIERPETGEGRRSRAMGEAQVTETSERVGLAAVKYFDLSHSLSSDYKFDLDTMLNLEGNTAPYMLYAYARIRSIGRKGGVDYAALPPHAPIVLEHPSEIALGKKLVQFADVVDVVSQELKPNALTDYLFELSKAFSRFYDKKLGVRVIDASPESLRISRLRLCDLTARVLRLGLRLLGIETVEQM
jgi:arginyl-tRNA synthetase